ncbi:ATP-dependent DNA helicase [Corynebacterium sanguinis]|uniref:ATP-dependent helicase DinG n=1 Tax=Corynebacterium sanguinis TaxID=2594913 RepID=A0A6I7R7A9_9CORY|nr:MULTISPECIES: ATP-dependent DNA helicase [Corynebacterium]MBA4505372.1 ATP-dependent DNA helicase [Corynebacterium sanguinis]MCT1414081.1 ATP-dependent DNA helicase [Corynebacterium sanguinis]MCT1426051.1 ATP-dependent DNA helicase [Corynebacterium sanguinis]MCT1444180.1 ATP-dependent DNA helicase [Corynebacterium sanguinis]MCT1464389.1 ATP-dependent DNA helicase [Corynebacterium sanguinis]
MSDQPLAQPTTDLLAAAVDALGGAERPGQVAMAKAVTRALEEERHLAVQAGTGTGKSLAYLVPAIRHAHATGGTVVVSTATIALQRQLVERDLPRLADALEPLLERRPTFAIQKGRNNYVCRHKLSLPGDVPEALIEEDDISWLGRHVKRVNEWAQETETGDRDDLEPGVPDLAWRQVSVTSSECLGAARCPHGEECFAELARERTRNVDLVVTNHALLAIDALADTDVLPEHDVVIIDEAHELDGRITSVATNEISARALTMASRRADKLGAEKGELETVVDDFAAAMNVETPGRWENISEAARGGFVAVRDALWHTREAIAKGPEGEADNEPETFAERENLKNHLGDLHDAIVRILGVFDEDDPTKHTDVVWLTRSERVGDSVSVAPLSVASLLRERLFGEHTVVLTSATLTIGGNFNAVAAAWGLPDGTWDGMDAGTPFNPRSSGILYTAAHLPAPGRDGLAAETLDEVAELITAAGGRTLGLFSSRRAAEQAAEAMRARLPFDILLQGEDSTGALVSAFAASENSCLFGTLSLWQGVDVPGSSLSLVIIDRIPFPRPDDPLLQARAKAANAAGRSGFMEVSATHAALLMAQGAGRLLRSVDDKGVVAVLDNRLTTKRYGSFLRKSLPAFWETTDPATVRAALRRLVAASH